jgi:hypothetical protein
MKFINAPLRNNFSTDNPEGMEFLLRIFDFQGIEYSMDSHDLRRALDSIDDQKNLRRIEAFVEATLESLSSYYRPSSAPDWKAVINCHIDGLGVYSVVADGETASVSRIQQPEPNMNIRTDCQTLAALFYRFMVIENSSDGELNDQDIEMVAGGKGNCSSDSFVNWSDPAATLCPGLGTI